jgi:hypothetical protein
MRADMLRARDWSPAVNWLRGLKGVTVCEPILAFYDRDCCWDHVHLNARGVDKFMPLVARDVRDAVGKR